MPDRKALNIGNPGIPPYSLGPVLDQLVDPVFRKQVTHFVDLVSEVSITIGDIVSVVKDLSSFVGAVTSFFEGVGLLGGSSSENLMAKQLQVISQQLNTLYANALREDRENQFEEMSDRAAILQTLRKNASSFRDGTFSAELLKSALSDATTAYDQLLADTRWLFYFWPAAVEGLEGPKVVGGPPPVPPGPPWIVAPPARETMSQDRVPANLVELVKPPSEYEKAAGEGDKLRFYYRPALALLECGGLILMDAIATLAAYELPSGGDPYSYGKNWLGPHVTRLRGFLAALDACVMTTRPIARADDAHAYQRCPRLMPAVTPPVDPWSSSHSASTEPSPIWPFVGRRPGNSVEGWPVGAMDTCEQLANIEARWKVDDGPGAGSKVSGCFDDHKRDDAYYAALNCAAWPAILNARRGLLVNSGFYSLIDLIQAMERWLPPADRAPLDYLSRDPSLAPVLAYARTSSLEEYLDKSHPNRNREGTVSLRQLLERGAVS